MPFFIGSGGNSVTVAVDNSMCRPGSTITGNAYVNIMTPTNFTGVYLKVKGHENVYWVEHQTRTRTVYRNGQSQTETYTVEVPHVGKRQIFKTEYMILQGGQMLQGQYTVPFSFMIPMGIPGSFELSGKDYSCSVRYAVKAKVAVPGMLKSDLKHQAPLTVIQPPPAFSTNISANALANVITWCCVNRGQAQLAFQADKDAFYTGEQVFLTASADNKSKSELKRLTIKLRRSLTITAGDGRSFHIEETVSERLYPGLKPFTSVENLAMQLDIPSNAPQMCFGSTIQCLYSVRLAGKVSWGKDATCTVPAFIYIPFREVPQAFQLAPTWQPVVLQPVTLMVTTPVLVPPPITLAMFPEYETMHATAPPAPGTPMMQQVPITPAGPQMIQHAVQMNP